MEEEKKEAGPTNPESARVPQRNMNTEPERAHVVQLFEHQEFTAIPQSLTALRSTSIFELDEQTTGVCQTLAYRVCYCLE